MSISSLIWTSLLHSKLQKYVNYSIDKNTSTTAIIKNRVYIIVIIIIIIGIFHIVISFRLLSLILWYNGIVVNCLTPFCAVLIQLLIMVNKIWCEQ